MNGSVVGHLILKDWRLHRLPIILSLVCGGIALAIIQLGGQTPVLLGTAWFFIALIIFGSLVPVTNIVNEKKKQTMAFLMSLPVSPVQYTTAKLVSTVGMFLGPWLMLVISALILIYGRGIFPHGVVPLMLILAAAPLLGFCLIAAGAHASEGWAIAFTVVCNSSYWLVWYALLQVPAVTNGLKSPVALWNPTVLAILGGEFGLIALVLGVTYFLQSRKRDFV
jgi:ABC-2 type transport system permease protein